MASRAGRSLQVRSTPPAGLPSLGRPRPIGIGPRSLLATVLPGPALQAVAAGATAERVVALLAEEIVVALSTPDVVALVAPAENVAGAPAAKVVAPVRPDDAILALAARTVSLPRPRRSRRGRARSRRRLRRGPRSRRRRRSRGPPRHCRHPRSWCRSPGRAAPRGPGRRPAPLARAGQVHARDVASLHEHLARRHRLTAALAGEGPSPPPSGLELLRGPRR